MGCCGCCCLKMHGNVRCILLPGLNALQPVSHFLSLLLAYGLAVTYGCCCLKMPGTVRCILMPGLNVLQPVSHFFVTILTTGRITMWAFSYMWMLLSEDACPCPMHFVAGPKCTAAGVSLLLSLLLVAGLEIFIRCSNRYDLSAAI